MDRLLLSLDRPSSSGSLTEVHSFVCRVWREDDGIERADGVWRGKLVHLPSGRVMYFQHLETLPKEMHRLLGEPPQLE